ncbi:hypothetical protein ILYODFUR_035963 [Ilyodon furcidens]|uniref:Uncharacterized protein n=1 Tax=Ilyodon furcidens TaxID=33524 RepID=A0ABV0VLF7_9TELE
MAAEAPITAKKALNTTKQRRRPATAPVEKRKMARRKKSRDRPWRRNPTELRRVCPTNKSPSAGGYPEQRSNNSVCGTQDGAELDL